MFVCFCFFFPLSQETLFINDRLLLLFFAGHFCFFFFISCSFLFPLFFFVHNSPKDPHLEKQSKPHNFTHFGGEVLPNEVDLARARSVGRVDAIGEQHHIVLQHGIQTNHRACVSSMHKRLS